MSDQIKFYVIPAVLYALVASPATYQTTRGLFGGWVASSEGTARIGGLILHAIVFIILATLAMRYFPSKRSEDYRTGGLIRQGGIGTMIGPVNETSPMNTMGAEI